MLKRLSGVFRCKVKGKRILSTPAAEHALLLMLLFMPIDTIHAERNNLQFRHMTADDGLSSSIIISIAQDYKGFMWLGTYDGLNRFDGTKIVTYKNNPSDSGSLIENHIQCIFEDRGKKLFIGTREGLSLYDRDRDRFINYALDSSSPLHGVRAMVNRIAEDAAGNLWLATDFNGLIYFNRRSNTITHYLHDPKVPGSISYDQMDYVYLDSRERLWVATKKGLNLFDPKNGTFRHVTRCATHGDTISDLFFLGIVEDHEGNIWFGSGNGLFCLENRGANQELALTHFQNNPKDPTSLSLNSIRSLYIDEDGALWVGTENGGINIYDKRKKNFTRYRIDNFNPMSLNSESIHALACDRQKNVWIGTWGGGVNIAIKNSDFIIHYKHVPGAPQSLSFNNVSCFAEDRLHRLWIGTDGGGFNCFNDTTGRFTYRTTGNSALKSDAIICMFKGRKNLLWIGTWEGGLVKYDYVSTTMTSLTKNNSGIPDNTFYAIAQDSLGDLWLGSFRQGLVHYRIKENAFEKYTMENSPIASNQINVVRIDRRGNVYIGSESKHCFQMFIPKENRFVTVNTPVPDVKNNINNAANDILIENDSCVWVATQCGLFRYDPLRGGFRWYFKKDGLPANNSKGLAIDSDGMLWLTTSAGLCRFDRSKSAFTCFSKSDGLQSNEFNRSSILTTSNGKILAGGTNGFNLISPGRYALNRSAPQIALTNFHIFNREAEIGAEDSPLKKHITETDKITLAYDQSVLTFSFVALDFTNPTKNQYAYRMENFDKDWIYCGTRKDATYTNLNPGTYFFHVKGSNNSGVWNTKGTSLEITITPPWWETKWARAVFLLLIILLLLGIYFYFRNKQEQKHLREIVASQKKIEDIMNSIDEAIFTVNEDMSVNAEHSKTAEKIFGTNEFDKRNIAALFNMDDKVQASFAHWLNLAFKQSPSPNGWDRAQRLAPIKEVIIERENKVFLSIHFQPIYEQGGLSRIMVIANDITQQKKIETYASELQAERELQMERVMGLVNNDAENIETIIESGSNFIQSFQSLDLNKLHACRPRLRTMSRDLHTLKGLSGSLGLKTLSSHCDDLETILDTYLNEKGRSGPNGDTVHITSTFASLSSEMQALIGLRTKLFSGRENRLSIDKTDFALFLERLEKGAFQSIDEIACHFRMLNSITFSEFCSKFSKFISEYAQRLQKNIEPLNIETPDMKAERKICKVLKGPLTHLLRNALDHGIEENSVREKRGKGPGSISLAMREKNGDIELEVSDDGGGIDPEQVAAAAVKKGFVTPLEVKDLTDAQKLNLIFLNGFSTRDTATEISGRGVGMDAVKTDIEKAGGQVELVSRVGQGTRITLRLPKN